MSEGPSGRIMGHISGAGADECKFGYALAETGRKMDIEKMGTMGGGEDGGWDATTLHCHHPITRTSQDPGIYAQYVGGWKNWPTVSVRRRVIFIQLQHTTDSFQT